MSPVRIACLVVVSGAVMAGSAIAEPAQQRGRGPAAPACTTVACDVQGDWERTKTLMMGLVNAMPDDKWGFKPTPAQQTFAERAMHVAQIDSRCSARSAARRRHRRPPTPKRSTKAEVVAALQASFDYGAAVIKEFNDLQLVERIASMPFLGPTASRLKVIYFSMQHTERHLRSARRVPAAERHHAAGEQPRRVGAIRDPGEKSCVRSFVTCLLALAAAPAAGQMFSRPSRRAAESRPPTSRGTSCASRFSTPASCTTRRARPCSSTATSMVRTGHYNGVPLYADATRDPYSVVYVPIGRGQLKPYERLRRGESGRHDRQHAAVVPDRAPARRPRGADGGRRAHQPAALGGRHQRVHARSDPTGRVRRRLAPHAPACACEQAAPAVVPAVAVVPPLPIRIAWRCSARAGPTTTTASGFATTARRG